MAKAVIVTRDVPKGELHNFAERDVAAGETLYQCTLPTYGCIDYSAEVPLTEQPDEYPFFGFPWDAVSDA